MFTDNDVIMSKIDAGDWLNGITLQNDEDDLENTLRQVPDSLEQSRPMTATKKFNAEEI